MDVSEYILLALASVIAAAIASVSGFGIGSILTPARDVELRAGERGRAV